MRRRGGARRGRRRRGCGYGRIRIRRRDSGGMCRCRIWGNFMMRLGWGRRIRCIGTPGGGGGFGVKGWCGMLVDFYGGWGGGEKDKMYGRAGGRVEVW